jgi:hypothetical protein
MRAPTNKRSTDEIVAEIIDHVGYFLKGVLDQSERERQRRWVEMHVRRRISDLRTKPLPFTGNQKKNVAYANEVRRQIDKLVRILKKPPNRFFSSALFGERFWSLLDRQEQEVERTAIEFNPQTQSYIAQDEPVHLKLFAAELNRLRSQCDRIIALRLGQHGSVEYRKEHAAIASREILEDVASNTGTDWQPTGAPTGKFCLVASLLFEAATGKHDADMRRHCKAVLRTKTKK